MRRTFIAACLFGLLALSAACGTNAKPLGARTLVDSARADSIARARQDSINRTMPGYVVDSIFPVEEELRRFRASLGGDSATKLVGGSSSREALVRRFIQALATNNLDDLRAMAVHGREFADLYYPESPYSHPPYKQSPALAWSMIQNPSTSGLTKIVARLGGRPLTYAGHVCDPKVVHDGRTTRYAGCLVRLVGTKGDTVTKRLFGSIIARDGQYKFLSYTNTF